jgi:hypothetical protein
MDSAARVRHIPIDMASVLAPLMLAAAVAAGVALVLFGGG